MGPLLDHGLALLVFGMGLACQEELHGMTRVAKQGRQPFRLAEQQIGPLVGGETTGKAHRQGIGIQYRLGCSDFFSGPMGHGQLLGETSAGKFDKLLSRLAA